jgi:LMBR1 domain-containing protein 1
VFSRYRPRRLAPDKLAETELDIQTRTTELIDLVGMLKKDRADSANSSISRVERMKKGVTDRTEVNRVAQMVFLLERDLDTLRACKAVGDQYNPFIPVGFLILGVIGSVVSVLWIVHMGVYMLADANSFLNAYFISFDSWFPMFGNISYAIFAVYLLFCTVKGCFKIGMKFVCIKIHPMVPGRTYTNAFLFNLAIVLVCTIPVIQFCTAAFAEYARFSDVFNIFNVQITYLKFYTIFYTNHVFVYLTMISFFFNLVITTLWPREAVSRTCHNFTQNCHNFTRNCNPRQSRRERSNKVIFSAEFYNSRLL